MAKHLYNSRVSKVAWFVKRFGLTEVFLKPLRTIFAPFIVPKLGTRSFEFDNSRLDYLYHAYNMTWACERCVEVPIGMNFVRRFPSEAVLEVGNVLSHYFPIKHDVLDKFEKGTGIINQDIATYTPHKKYRLILSISTFEHIGYDDDSMENSRGKILEAITNCTKMLQNDGSLVITVPIGYNPQLDDLIKKDELNMKRAYFLKRKAKLDWQCVLKNEAMGCKFAKPFPYANAILIAEFEK